MPAKTESSPSAGSEEQARRWSTWLEVLIALALGVIAVIVYGYLASPGWVGVSGKSFWDFLELLIVPAALAIGAFLLNQAQERERQAQDARRDADRAVEADQRERDRTAAEEARQRRELWFANQTTQNAELQAYMDQMTQLLLDRNLRNSEHGSEVRTLARARTRTLLTRLDGARKAQVVQFLYESDLIAQERPVLDLSGADLSAADLSGAVLGRADLRERSGANLRGADLSGADLGGAVLIKANLSGANLSGSILSGAILREADLSHAKGVAKEQLSAASALEGATMPDGQTLKSATNPVGPTFEDWLKSKGSGEDGENSDPS
jgi:uncharacterized protein YjbI with pentapeptide repeats